MRRRSAIGIAVASALIALVPAAASAQQRPESNSAGGTGAANPAPVVTPPPLSNFSINGTVTRPADQPPAVTPPANQAAPAQPSTTQAAPDRATQRPAPAAPSGGSAARAPAPGPSVTVALPPPTAAQPGLETPGPEGVAPLELPTPVDEPAGTGGAPLNPWPWLAAVLALAAGGFLVWRSRRRRERYAYALAAEDEAEAVEPAPAASAPARAPSPDPAPSQPPVPAPIGIVSTGLRPWLDIKLVPGRAVVDDKGASIDFEVVVHNSGAAPARDVLVEACMFNAGPEQDKQIGGFFAHPVARGDRLEKINPLQQIVLRSTVRLAPEEMRQFEVGGRKLFVPLIGLNTLYRWSGGEGQTSSSYFVGRESKAEKMAPFRLDLGPKLFRGLGAREHSVTVRS